MPCLSQCFGVPLTCAFHRQLQSFKVQDINQDYETGTEGTTMVTFKVDFDQAESLKDALKNHCSRELEFY